MHRIQQDVPQHPRLLCVAPQALAGHGSGYGRVGFAVGIAVGIGIAMQDTPCIRVAVRIRVRNRDRVGVTVIIRVWVSVVKASYFLEHTPITRWGYVLPWYFGAHSYHKVIGATQRSLCV